MLSSTLLVSDHWPLLSRQAAKSLKLKRFFDGPTCKRGHRSGRYASDNGCVVCRESQATQYAQENFERVKETRKAWLAGKPGYWREWYTENADDQRAKMRQRRVDRPDIYRAHSRNRRAKDQAAEGSHTAADIARIRKAQKGRCAYCRDKLTADAPVDHIVPLARGGSNWPKNLQLVCVSCNHKKYALLPEAYARKIGKLI